MNKKINISEESKKLVKAALIRAVKTAIQVMLTYITIGMTIEDVDWQVMFSAGLVAFGYAFAWNIIKKPPEAIEPDTDGSIIFTYPETEDAACKVVFDITSNLEDIMNKDTITLKSLSDLEVDPQTFTEIHKGDLVGSGDGYSDSEDSENGTISLRKTNNTGRPPKILK